MTRVSLQAMACAGLIASVFALPAAAVPIRGDVVNGFGPNPTDITDAYVTSGSPLIGALGSVAGGIFASQDDAAIEYYVPFARLNPPGPNNTRAGVYGVDDGGDWGQSADSGTGQTAGPSVYIYVNFDVQPNQTYQFYTFFEDLDMFNTRDNSNLLEGFNVRDANLNSLFPGPDPSTPGGPNPNQTVINGLYDNINKSPLLSNTFVNNDPDEFQTFITAPNVIATGPGQTSLTLRLEFGSFRTQGGTGTNTPEYIIPFLLLPLPAPIWMLLAGIVGLGIVGRKRAKLA